MLSSFDYCHQLLYRCLTTVSSISCVLVTICLFGHIYFLIHIFQFLVFIILLQGGMGLDFEVSLVAGSTGSQALQAKQVQPVLQNQLVLVLSVCFYLFFSRNSGLSKILRCVTPPASLSLRTLCAQTVCCLHCKNIDVCEHIQTWI